MQRKTPAVLSSTFVVRYQIQASLSMSVDSLIEMRILIM